MVKISMLVILLNLVFPSAINQSKYDICKLLIDWNKKTLYSLERQGKAASSDVKRKDYAGRIVGFNQLMQINNKPQIECSSIRYTFLKKIEPELQQKEAFVIESNINASAYIIRNFVVSKHTKDSAIVDLYFYLNDKGWYKKGTDTVADVWMELPLDKYITNAGHGFNNEDVTISYIALRKEHRIASEYFLFGTLSAENPVSKLLSMYERGSFRFMKSRTQSLRDRE